MVTVSLGGKFKHHHHERRIYTKMQGRGRGARAKMICHQGRDLRGWEGVSPHIWELCEKGRCLQLMQNGAKFSTVAMMLKNCSQVRLYIYVIALIHVTYSVW